MVDRVRLGPSLLHLLPAQGPDAWAHARQHPAGWAAITVGLAAAAVAFWAVGHFQGVDRARQAFGA